MSQVTGASIKPTEMVSGGIIDNTNAVVRLSRFEVWDYGGKSPVPTLAVKVTLATDDGLEANQFYSAGDPNNFAPSADGKRAVPTGSATALNQNTNLAVLMKNLVAAGFPENRLGDDISVIENLYAFWQRVSAPDRPGLARAADARPQTVLVPTKIHNLPWEASKQGGPAMAAGPAAAPTAAAAGAPATAATPAAAPSSDSDVMARAVTFLVDCLDAKSPVTRQELTGMVFSKLGADPQRNDIAKMVFSPEFLIQVQGMGIAAVSGDSISKA